MRLVTARHTQEPIPWNLILEGIEVYALTCGASGIRVAANTVRTTRSPRLAYRVMATVGQKSGTA